MACLLTDENIARLLAQVARPLSDVDENLALFNDTVETEMEEERQKILTHAQRIRDEGPTLDAQMPSTAAIVAAANSLDLTSASAVVTPRPAEPPVLSQRMMHGILTAAALTFVKGLPRIIACAPDDRAAMVLEVLEEVPWASAVAVASIWVVDKVKKALHKSIANILDALGENKKNVLIVSLLVSSQFPFPVVLCRTSST